ncbi:MAG: hypothetical protein ACE5IJ_06875 [Thermoplasmata archaeon]
MKERVLFRGKEFKRRNIGWRTRYWHRCDKLFSRQLRNGTLGLYPRYMTFEVELRSDFYGWLTRDKDRYVRLKLISTCVESRPKDLPEITEANYIDDLQSEEQ